MQKLLLPVAATILSVVTPISASAWCNTSKFNVPWGGETSTTQITDAKGCRVNYLASGTSTFTAASIENSPEHGTLRQRSSFDFGYLPKPGYKGSDKYTIKLCGTGRANSGCSLITYLVTIN